jgi:hypothetical protein
MNDWIEDAFIVVERENENFPARFLRVGKYDHQFILYCPNCGQKIELE